MNISYRNSDVGTGEVGTGEVSPDEEYDDRDIISLPSQPESPLLMSNWSSFDDKESIEEHNNHGEWVDMEQMANGRFRFAAATANGRLYVFGGRTWRKRLNGIEMWTPGTRSWIDTIPSMDKTCAGASAVVVGDDIYITGGLEDSDNKPGNSCKKFDIRTNSFTTMPPMAIHRDRHNSVAVGKKIYVFAGLRKKSCEIFDVVEKKWVSMAKTNEERSLCAAVAVDNKIYCIGGTQKNDKQEQYLNSMEVYDIEKDKWTLSNAKMNNRRAGCCAVTDGSKITVIGGHDGEKDVLAIEEFDIEENEWRPSSTYHSLERGRSQFSAMLIGRDLIIMGGLRDNSMYKAGTLNSVQVCRKILNAPPYICESIRKSNELNNIKKIRRSRKKQAAKKVRNNNKAVKFRAKAKTTSTVQRGVNRMPTQREKKKSATNKAIAFEHKVAKKFKGDRGDEIHIGTATKTKSSDKLWTVVYDDGDSEEFDIKELSQGRKFYDKVKENLKSSLFGEERFLSFQKAKESKEKKIEEYEEALFGCVQDGSLYERLSDLELKIGAPQTTEPLSKERFESLGDIIKSRTQTIEDYEKDVYGESKAGFSLMERMKNLEKFLL